MARFSQLAAACLLAVAGVSAHAGYAQLAPPAGFAPMPAAAPIARYGYAAANEAAWVNQTVRVNAGLNVGGQAIKVPAAMRLAANAPRFAAAAIFAHPAFRLASGISLLLGAAKVMWDESQNSWVTEYTTDKTKVDLFEWETPGLPKTSSPLSQISSHLLSQQYPGMVVLDSSGKFINENTYQTRVVIGYPKTAGTVYINNYSRASEMKCPFNTTSTPAGCVGRIKIGSQEEFIDRVINPANNPGWPNVPADWPMPSTVPKELPPGTPLPVEQPIINPTPGDNPRPQPYFVPTGNPVPNPNYDPNAAPSPENQPWFQPGVRIVPSPTLDEPWRVDVQPVNRPTASPDPKSTDELNPQPNPATNPDPGKDDKAKPEEQQSLCEKHPEILACQKLDTPDAKELAKEDISISISPVAGWGSDTAACPTPRSVMLAGKEVSISWQPVCDFATGLRPLVIAMAWLSAVSMVIVVARRT